MAIGDRIGGPHGLITPVVDDQVGILLHGHTDGVLAFRLGTPDWTPAEDDKVAVLLPKEQTDRKTVRHVHKYLDPGHKVDSSGSLTCDFYFPNLYKKSLFFLLTIENSF